MKKNIFVGAIVFFILAIILFLLIQNFSKDNNVQNNENIVDASDYIVAHNQIGALPIENLSQEEKDGLIMMREEEKLAHDVYITLYEKWQNNIFRNIASSESTHTDAVRYLIERYKLEDPTKDNTVGVFSNPTFSKLYKDLVEKGNNSLSDALLVGATIEDLDIKDLQDLITKTNNQDILVVYDNLSRGSRNHLRAFSKQLSKLGMSYSAQYLTQEQINNIISSVQEKGY